MKPSVSQNDNSKEAVPSGHVLAVSAQNKLAWSTAAHTRRSELQELDAQVLSAVPGEGLVVPLPLLGVSAASVRAHWKTNR